MYIYICIYIGISWARNVRTYLGCGLCVWRCGPSRDQDGPRTLARDKVTGSLGSEVIRVGACALV